MKEFMYIFWQSKYTTTNLWVMFRLVLNQPHFKRKKFLAYRYWNWNLTNTLLESLYFSKIFASLKLSVESLASRLRSFCILGVILGLGLRRTRELSWTSNWKQYGHAPSKVLLASIIIQMKFMIQQIRILCNPSFYYKCEKVYDLI